MQEINVSNRRSTTIKKIIARLPFFDYGYDFTEAIKQIENPSFIYMRQTIFDKGLYKFLKLIKLKYPTIKIIVEVVTYPYKYDFFKRVSMWPLFIKDHLNFKRSAIFINRIVTFSKHDKILGINTIKTINGIKLDDYEAIKPLNHDNVINLISVAVMQPHHGYERLILGLNEYYKNKGNRNIVYHVVGNGFNGQIEFYKDLVRKFKLEDRVLFYGKKTGKELAEIYNLSDIGICSLGSYKIKVDASSQLKSREYLAKGLPMITGCYVDVLNDCDFKYYLQFENNNTPLNVDRIVEFYDILSRTNRNDLIYYIRDFAEKHISIETAFREVIMYIEETNY